MRALRMSAYVHVHIRVSTLVYVHVQVCTLYASALSLYGKLNVRMRLNTNGYLHLDASFVQGLLGCTTHSIYVHMCVSAKFFLHG